MEKKPPLKFVKISWHIFIRLLYSLIVLSNFLFYTEWQDHEKYSGSILLSLIQNDVTD